MGPFGTNIGTVDSIDNAAGTAAIPIATTAAVETKSFPLYGGDAFGVELLASSDGDVDLLVQLEESMDGTNFVVPDGLAEVANVTDEIRHIRQVSPVPAKYGKFKITGQTTNDATTTITINLFRQEQT